MSEAPALGAAQLRYAPSSSHTTAAQIAGAIAAAESSLEHDNREQKGRRLRYTQELQRLAGPHARVCGPYKADDCVVPLQGVNPGSDAQHSPHRVLQMMCKQGGNAG
jgi:hypothetical protein